MKKSQINLSKIETEKKNGEEMYSVYFWIYSLESYTASEIWHYNLVCSSHDTKIQQTLLYKSYN